MTILLVGGGSGGHIIPLLAVARNLKKIDPALKLIGVCESDAKFLHLFETEPTIDATYQVQAGKYRRYAGLSRLERLLDIPTVARNTRDVGRVVKGYAQARKMLKSLKPDGILIKGGFVGVPVGLAAAHLGIPYVTHDSDSTPGLANRLIAKWALKHATGMPVEFYSYPKGSMIYTGVPISSEFIKIDSKLQADYKNQVGLSDCDNIVTIIGGSQGGQQLNEDIAANVGRLMQRHHNLGIIHIVGPTHEHTMKISYAKELLADELRRVVIKGFVPDVYRYTGAADVIVSRASATVIAELSVQAKAIILVPGHLADDHQSINALNLAKSSRVIQVAYGDREGLAENIGKLLSNPNLRNNLSNKLHELAKPNAASELADLLLSSFKAGKS